jgi:hypothetical protein
MGEWQCRRTFLKLLLGILDLFLVLLLFFFAALRFLFGLLVGVLRLLVLAVVFAFVLGLLQLELASPFGISTEHHPRKARYRSKRVYWRQLTPLKSPNVGVVAINDDVARRTFSSGGGASASAVVQGVAASTRSVIVSQIPILVRSVAAVDQWLVVEIERDCCLMTLAISTGKC